MSNKQLEFLVANLPSWNHVITFQLAKNQQLVDEPA
jgi:hypothetical protein